MYIQHTCTHTYTFTYIHIHTRIYRNMHVNKSPYTNTYIHIYTHTSKKYKGNIKKTLKCSDKFSKEIFIYNFTISLI